MGSRHPDFCPGCGSRVAGNWTFCQTCGQPLVGPDPPSAADPEEALPGRLGTRIGIVAAVVVGMVVAVGGGLMAARSLLDRELDDDPTETAAIDIPTTQADLVLAATTTTTPATTSTRPLTTTSTIPASPTTVFGDLNLAIPMARPDCDGTYITLIGASVEPDGYPSEVTQILDAYPGSNYLRTDVTCLSLRQHLEGNPIYGVFYGPFNTFQEACDARSLGPSGSYVKRLDNVSDPEVVPRCG